MDCISNSHRWRVYAWYLWINDESMIMITYTNICIVKSCFEHSWWSRSASCFCCICLALASSIRRRAVRPMLVFLCGRCWRYRRSIGHTSWRTRVSVCWLCWWIIGWTGRCWRCSVWIKCWLVPSRSVRTWCRSRSRLFFTAAPLRKHCRLWTALRRPRRRGRWGS